MYFFCLHTHYHTFLCIFLGLLNLKLKIKVKTKLIHYLYGQKSIIIDKYFSKPFLVSSSYISFEKQQKSHQSAFLFLFIYFLLRIFLYNFKPLSLKLKHCKSLFSVFCNNYETHQHVQYQYIFVFQALLKKRQIIEEVSLSQFFAHFSISDLTLIMANLKFKFFLITMFYKTVVLHFASRNIIVNLRQLF